MATSPASDADLDAASCSVCKDIYKNPVKICCGHTFCEDCIEETWRAIRDGPTCPVCRKSVDGVKTVDMEMLTKMSKKSTPCTKCMKVVILTEYRRHERTCSAGGNSFGASGSGTSRLVDFSGGVKPNIYTFICPYCNKPNLARESLLAHVNEQHKGDQTKIVCPICKVMPWGNIDQYSQNFPDHLNIRHKFDYDRFVDLNQDEESSLQNAVKKSTRQF